MWRTYSGYDKIDAQSIFNSLSIFSNANEIGFMRVIDGKVATSSCEVGTDRIVSIAHDNSAPGRFYVGTESGDLISFAMRTHEKNEISCDIEGKMVGAEGKDYSMLVLNQYLIKVHRNGVFHMYNITEAKKNPSMVEFAKLSYVVYKPPHLKLENDSSEMLVCLETQSSEGNTIAIVSPRFKNQLIVMDVINPKERIDSWANVVVDNKSAVFALTIAIVLGYQFLFKRSTPSASKNLQKERMSRAKNENSALDKLSERLKGLDQAAELVDKLAQDQRIKGESVKKKHPKQRFGNRIDFLE
jgi:hypothetical protein